MNALSGYQILTQIYESAHSLVYRGIREEDNQGVILKFLKEEYPTLEEIIRYKQEYKITHNLNLEGVVKAYKLEKYQNSFVIVFEDFGGESLKIMTETRRLTLKEFLIIAIKVSQALAEIHNKHIIHKDINPSNIVFNPCTHQLKLIDFGISTIFSRDKPNFKNPNILEGTLAYISPEQTGRMNRSLDYRTDFYSLGVTFYELLTEQLPFDSNDPIELVHFHMAKQPVPPHQLNSYIPEVLSNLVIKLLAKTAEERYQSAWGIKSDLEKILCQLQNKNKVSLFSLGRHDICEKFKIPQKMYGRNREIETLLTAFERVVGGEDTGAWEREDVEREKSNIHNPQSTIEMMLISGYSGIGKSSLVQEIYKPITKHKGYFLAGKFDQFSRNIPYSAIISAFSTLVKQLLTETADSLAQWREKFLAALGSNGQVLIEVIPDLELIINKQPKVLELSPSEAQNRLNLLFKKFIKVFTQPEHPLVIFLDDLQWVDVASLKLLEFLMTAPDNQYLFFIGAYRDNEVGENHPLMITINQIKKSGVRVNHIAINPLNLDDVNQLISDTLNCNPAETLPLAELVQCKTGGNPFFLNEFLKSIYTEKLIQFEWTSINTPILYKTPTLTSSTMTLPNHERIRESQGKWKWDLEQIKALGITDNVVELMTGKIQQLSPTTQLVLQFAAVIGNQFDLQTLALILEQSQTETALHLHEALTEELVLPIGGAYKGIHDLEINSCLQNSQNSSWIPYSFNQNQNQDFPNYFYPNLIEYQFAHDRIQQAAYSLIPLSNKQAIHLQVGRLLLRSLPKQAQDQKIFDIVNQLNFGIKLITVQSEKEQLAQLNFTAGKKAKASAAYESAWNYLSIGISCLHIESWKKQYDLTLALYTEAAEAASLSGRFDEMERLVSLVLRQAKNLLDKVKVYEIKIQSCTAHNQPLEAINTALSVLKMLKINFHQKPNKLNILIELIKTKLALTGKRIEDLRNLPQMIDPYKLATMRILSSVASAAYFAIPELFALIVLKQVDLSIKYGNTAVSPYAYATYGLILSGEAVGDIESGYQFGQLALNLLDQFNTQELKARTLLIVNYFIRHWKEHLRETLTPLLDAYLIGLETGDLEYAAYSACVYSYHSYVLGKNLVELEREMAMYSNTLKQLKQETAFYYNQLNRQFVLNLMGQSEDKCRLVGESYDEVKMLPLHLEANAQNICHSLYFYKLVLCYLFEDYQQALENAEFVEKYLDNAVGSIPLSHFYNSLVHLARYSLVSRLEQKKILLKIKINQKKLKKWARYAPMTHLHKFYLVEAERYRVLGNQIKASNYYDQAIELAQEHKYIHEEALAHELAGKFYLNLGKVKIARVYLLDARYCYQQWGAMAKVKDLEARYPHLLFRQSDNNRPTHGLRTSNSSTGAIKRNSSANSVLTSSGSSEALDLATVIKANQAISREMILDKLLVDLMKILIENAGAQKGFLILEKAGKLQIETEGSVDQDHITVLHSIPLESMGGSEKKQPFSPAIINYVARTFETVVLNDAVHEGQFIHDSYITQTQAKSILCFPLINQGKLVSIVYLENNLTTGAFTADRLEVLKLLSSQAAIAIENAKLYSEVKESERRLTQFLEAMPVGVSVLDASGKPYYGNRIAHLLLDKGVLPETTPEQIAQVYQIYIAGTDQTCPTPDLPGIRALMGESVTAENLEIHKENEVIPIEVWGTPIFDEKGNVAYSMVAFQDITERKQAEAEREKFTSQLYQLNDAFSRFVPGQFLQFLEKESIVDVQLGDHVQKEMSVLFSDIRDFTSLSESMTPQENFRFINAFLSRMEPAIIEHQGFIDKYVGDAIMALFGGSADDAVKAAIAMLHQLTEYNQHRANSGYVPIQIGIGINTGSLMLGTVGGQNRMDTTVISDAVNLASRIEGLTKNYGASLLISHHTFAQLKDANQYIFRLIDRVHVKGKSALVSVYEIFDADLPQIREKKLVTKTTFEEALLLYNLCSFGEAATLFAQVLAHNPEDTAAQIYLDRCNQAIS